LWVMKKNLKFLISHRINSVRDKFLSLTELMYPVLPDRQLE